MDVQLGIGVAGNALLVIGALAGLALFHPYRQGWTVAAGGPLGWIALAALLAVVLLVGLAVLLTWRYWQRRASTAPHAPPWLFDLLNSLPMAALVASQDGRVVTHNTEATRLLGLSGRDLELPLALHTLVQRVLVSDMSETTEIPAPDDAQRRLAPPLQQPPIQSGETDGVDPHPLQPLHQHLVDAARRYHRKDFQCLAVGVPADVARG